MTTTYLAVFYPHDLEVHGRDQLSIAARDRARAGGFIVDPGAAVEFETRTCGTSRRKGEIFLLAFVPVRKVERAERSRRIEPGGWIPAVDWSSRGRKKAASGAGY